MIEVRGNVNELELIVVLEELKKRGTEWATIRPGNNCIWVSTGSASIPINEYFIFHGGKLVDVQID